MPREQDSDDPISERHRAFHADLGIYMLLFPQMLEASVQHALAGVRRAGPADPPWRCMGPRNVGGRVAAIAQDPTNPLVLYAGAAFGGLWRTRDAGDSWEPLGGDQDVFAVGAIAIPVQRPDIVYVGTGSLSPDMVSGRGIFLFDARNNRFYLLAPSPNGTDPPASATAGSALRYTRIQVDPDDPFQFWATSQTGLWRCNTSDPATGAPARNWRRETDPLFPAFAARHLPETGFWPSWATDLRVSRDPSTTKLFNGRARFLHLFLGIERAGVFRGRFDRRSGNIAWGRLNVPPAAPPQNFTRVIMGQCQHHPNHVYAVFANNTGTGVPEHNHATNVFYSANSGDNWSQQGRIPRAFLHDDVPSPSDGQADYDLVLEVNPENPRVLVCGEIDLCKSEDFGATWTPILQWHKYNAGDHAQHADQHFALFDSGDHRKLWACNDGGISLARDLRRFSGSPGYWRKRSHGIFCPQMQDVTVHPVANMSFMSGAGMQDNGSFLSYGGPTWYQVGIADGAQFAPHAGNPRLFFVAQQRVVRLTSIAGAASPQGRSIAGSRLADLPDSIAAGHTMHVQLDTFNNQSTNLAPFIGLVVQDPARPGQALMAAIADGTVSVAVIVPAPAAPAAHPALPAAVPRLDTVLLGGPPLANVAVGEEGSALAYGPFNNAWIGTDQGQLFFTNQANVAVPAPVAPPAAQAVWPAVWNQVALALPLHGGVPRRVTGIVVHPQDPRIVAVCSVPNPPQVTVQIAPGGAGFVFSIGLGAFGGAPIPIAAAVPTRIPGTATTVTFNVAPPYTAGDMFFIDANDNVTIPTTNSAVGVAAAITAVTAVDIVITILAGAQFRFAIGPLTGNLPIAAQVVIPNTQTTVFFRNPPATYNVNDSWTIAPGDVITAAAANSGAGVVGAIASITRLGGRVHITYDRGGTWAEITHPREGGAPRPVPDLQALPPCPVASLFFDLNAGNLNLYAGTLVGVYVCPIPTPTGANPLTVVSPAARLARGITVQLRANLAVTVLGAPIDVTLGVTWASSNAARATVAVNGQITVPPGAPAGPVTITATRDAAPPATVNLTIDPGAPVIPLGPPPAAPNIAPDWRPFNNGLPLALVNDIEQIPGTRILRIATFDRGVFDCDLAGAPRHRLFLRQTLIEDGRTRYTQATLPIPDDPRVPAGAVALDLTHAFDIRIDSSPFKFFDDQVDGVEFDEEVPADDLKPLAPNAIYVQVLNRGTDPVTDAQVHLYWVRSPAAAPIGPPPMPAFPGTLGDPQPVNFYYDAASNPPIPPAVLPPLGVWTRVEPAKPVPAISTTQPRVIRFDWVPPAELAGTHVALLALCMSPADLAINPRIAGLATVQALIERERRAALRIVHVGGLPSASVAIRDGVDEVVGSGEVSFAGRSPDIIVVQHEHRNAAQDFRDLRDERLQDGLTPFGDVTNHVYVRIHNRGPQTVNAEASIYAVRVGPDNAPVFTGVPGSWTTVAAPAPAIDVPPRNPAAVIPANSMQDPRNGMAYVHATIANSALPDANPGDPYKTYAFVVVIRSTNNQDPLPDLTRINSLETFWKFFLTFANAKNAAIRVVRVVGL